LVHKPRILLIDDDETVRDTVSAVLEENGYIVDMAKNGKEAIVASNTKFYNLALIDIKLPDVEGVELLAAMKETTPEMVKIVVTGYPTLENAINALNQGADGYIVKPFKNEELLDKIQKHLKKQQDAKYYNEEKIADFIESRSKEMESQEHV